MADDLSRRRPEDPKKINVNQVWELDYWSTKLGVSTEMLRIAVSAVGPLVLDVKRYLGR